MTKKFLMAVLFIALVGLGVGAAHADTINLSSSSYVGQIHKGTPSSEAYEVTYINNLISVLASSSKLIDSRTYTRSSNTATYPTAVLLGNTGNCDYPKYCSASSINVSGYDYLLAKYGTDDYVWYVAGLDTVNIPTSLGRGAGLSHWTLFGASGAPPVPEPASMALLSTGLFGMAGAIRRKFRK